MQGALGTRSWWEAREARLARRRPRANGLAIDAIVAAAIALVDRDGLDALTTRRLADELGTASASLYRHVASRDELLVLMIDAVLGEVPRPDATALRTLLEQVFRGLRATLRRHPHLVPAVLQASLQGPNARRGIEAGLATLVDAGLEPRAALDAYLVALDYVVGSVAFDAAQLGRHGARPDEEPVTLPTGHPRAAEMRTALVAVDADATFEAGLRAILDGLGITSDP